VGEAQIRFRRDNTKLVMGPHSEILIGNFVFNEQNTATIECGQRTFRLNGRSSKARLLDFHPGSYDR